MLKGYLKELFETAKHGDAREESYYPNLKTFLEAFGKESGHSKVQVTVQPKKTDAGNPDFRIWDGKQHIVGYIEAKSPTQENLDTVETSDQLKRYLHTFPNLILTNFFQFRLYRNGIRIGDAKIARAFTAYKLKSLPDVQNEKEFFDLLEKFFSFSLPQSYSAKSLAVELAKRTRFLKELILAELESEIAKKKPSFISGFYEAFERFLIGSLKKNTFADLYAQTITYGLFAARTRGDREFSRKLAYDLIPHTIGILREMFHFISLGELPPQMEWIVDDIAEVLSVADIDKILKDRRERDPIVHFYEPFLAEYDPEERERRGVYYTPEPVVSYIVKSLHRILKVNFNQSDGFASSSIRVLDPAAGTCTFPAEATRQAIDEFAEKYGEGAKAKLIPDHILKNFYGFELMMAPYAIGHLKIGYLLQELGHPLQKDERLKLYLTNTLDMEELQESKLPGMSSLSEESHLAGKVKKQIPILVILGNPPYSGHSSNVGEWISNAIKDYYKVDGKPLGERNPKWLQDDYVKFIRFAQWKIEQAGEGVLGFITNHGYLDSPTFRGMRQSLMDSFEQIHLLDLHGSTMKKERCPDGSKDENVFEIRPGVAIGLFIKKKGLTRAIYHADLWGGREKKYTWLEDNDIATTKWTEIRPKPGFYLFVPRDEKKLEQYNTYPRVIEIFPVNVMGIQTHRDAFVIDMKRDALRRRIAMFRDEKLTDEIIRQTFDLEDNRDWAMSESRKLIFEDKDWDKKFLPIIYRPFDVRHIFYHKDAIDFGRQDVMRHMIGKDNLALLISRRSNQSWQHALITDAIAVDIAISTASREANQYFPLWLYNEADKHDLFKDLATGREKTANLNPRLLKTLEVAYGDTHTPEEIFYYIYAVLYSPSYRSTYAEFLNTDFPRVPFPRDKNLFEQCSKMGKSLSDLHLLRSPALDEPISHFCGAGDNVVERQAYDEKTKRVYINENQYFDGVQLEVWDYEVGGYQVLERWLKDRKRKALTTEDIKHYCRIVTVIDGTIEIQAAIEAIFSKIIENVVAIELTSN